MSNRPPIAKLRPIPATLTGCALLIAFLFSPANAQGQVALKFDAWSPKNPNLALESRGYWFDDDVDGDGRIDFVRLRGARVEAFLQIPGGGFEDDPSLAWDLQQDDEMFSFAPLGLKGRPLVTFGSEGVCIVPPTKARDNSTSRAQWLIHEPLLLQRGDGLPSRGTGFVPWENDPVGLLVVPRADGWTPYRRTGPLSYEQRDVLPTSVQPYLRQWINVEVPGEDHLQSFYPSDSKSKEKTVRIVQRVSFNHAYYVFADFDGDGRPEAVEVGEGKKIRKPDETGKYTETSDQFAIPSLNEETGKIEVASDVSNFLTGGELVDVDGDGLLDHLQTSADSSEVNPKSEFRLFLGEQPYKISGTPAQTIRIGAMTLPGFNTPLCDLNRDGMLDLAMIWLDIKPYSPQEAVRDFLDQGIDGELQFFLYRKGKGWPSSPDVKKKVRISFDLFGFSFWGRPQLSLDEDFDGDGKPDLAIKNRRQELQIFLQRKDKTEFESRPAARVKTTRPISGIECKDLNADGRADLIVYTFDDDDRDYRGLEVFISQAVGNGRQ